MGRMPSTVHYTITFTDEYGDEHVTSLLSVEYKTKCTNTLCLSHPDFVKQTLQEHAESVNQPLGALPRGAIENKYVWTVGTTYGADGKAVEVTWPDATKAKWQTYPKDATKPDSTPVDQLEYRLDTKVIHAGCQGVDLTGTVANAQYGLCVFVQIENPGVQHAFKVRYFYNPSTTSDQANVLVTEVVSGQTSGFNARAIDNPGDVFSPSEPLHLVTVQDLQPHRKWNSRDGDVSKLFISENIWELDCCSGYSGIRCDDQNAIAYSY